MRATNGPKTRAKRKAVKKFVKGAWGTKHTSYKIARQTMIRASVYAFAHRKAKKRDFRELWIQRINAAIRPLNLSYSKFINLLKKNNIEINRKMLSELAINNPNEFNAIVNSVSNK